MTEASNQPESMQAGKTAPGLAVRWQSQPWHWALVMVSLGLLVTIFFDGLTGMISAWESEEYSHGYLLPLVAAFLVWQRSSLLAQTEFRMSWAGVFLTLFGLFVYLVGELGTLYTVVQYGFKIKIGVMLMSLMGWIDFRIIYTS